MDDNAFLLLLRKTRQDPSFVEFPEFLCLLATDELGKRLRCGRLVLFSVDTNDL